MKNKNWCVKQKIYIFAVNYDLVSYKSVKIIMMNWKINTVGKINFQDIFVKMKRKKKLNLKKSSIKLKK